MAMRSGSQSRAGKSARYIRKRGADAVIKASHYKRLAFTINDSNDARMWLALYDDTLQKRQPEYCAAVAQPKHDDGA